MNHIPRRTGGNDRRKFTLYQVMKNCWKWMDANTFFKVFLLV